MLWKMKGCCIHLSHSASWIGSMPTEWQKIKIKQTHGKSIWKWMRAISMQLNLLLWLWILVPVSFMLPLRGSAEHSTVGSLPLLFPNVISTTLNINKRGKMVTCTFKHQTLAHNGPCYSGGGISLSIKWLQNNTQHSTGLHFFLDKFCAEIKSYIRVEAFSTQMDA